MSTTTTTTHDLHPMDLTVSPTPTNKQTHLRPQDGLIFYQLMLAGSIAGCAEHMAMFPVDTLKTRMQALGSCPIKSANLKTSFQTLFKSDGLSGFYRGISAMGLGAGPAHAVYFSVYELCKNTLSNRNTNIHLAHAASGVCATVMSDAVLTPMDMVKQRLQLSGGGVGVYKGVFDCVKRVFKDEGFVSFYASYRITLLMNAPFTAVHFATYEAAKKGFVHVDALDDTLFVHATSGALAGALAAFVTTPFDVVKTQFQCQGVCGCDRFKNGSITHVIKTIVEKDGYKGLLRGWIPRMLFHAPAAAICWSTYEAAKDFFHDRNDQNNHIIVT